MAWGTRVGRLEDDGTVYRGSGNQFSDEAVGRIDPSGEVYSGTERFNETRVGQLKSDRTVWAGPGKFSQEQVGYVDDNGHVLDGPQFRGQQVGQVNTPAAGAVLRLLIEPDDPVRGPALRVPGRTAGQPAVSSGRGVAGGILAALAGAVGSALSSKSRRSSKPSSSVSGVPSWWKSNAGIRENAALPKEYRASPVPPDVEMLLDELRLLGDSSDVDDADAGLAFQYLVGIVDKAELIELRDQRRKLKYLIDRGLWKP